MSLWVDEANIANIISSSDGFSKYLVHPASHRPLLYLMISDFLSSIYNSEMILRLTSLVPGIFSLFIIIPISFTIFRNRPIAVLSLFWVAVNPYLINFSKDFKPYILEYFLCLCCIFLVVEWLKRKKDVNILVYSLLIIPATLLGFPLIFVIPCSSSVLLWKLQNHRNTRLKWIVLFSTFISISIFLTQYLIASRHTQTASFFEWGDFFYTGSFSLEMFSWGGNHLVKMLLAFTSAPIFIKLAPQLPEIITVTLALGFLLAFVRFIAKKEWELVVLLFGPIFLSLLLSYTGKWPFGVTRTSVYLISFLPLITLIGWDYLFEKINKQAVCIFFVILIVAIQFPYKLDFYNQKHQIYWTPTEDFVGGVNDIINNFDKYTATSQPSLIVFNMSSAIPYKYYTKYHSELSKKYQPFFDRNNVEFLQGREPKKVELEVIKKLIKNGSAWFLFYHYKEAEIQAFVSILSSDYVVVNYYKHFIQTSIFKVTLKNRNSP